MEKILRIWNLDGVILLYIQDNLSREQIQILCDFDNFTNVDPQCSVMQQISPSKRREIGKRSSCTTGQGTESCGCCTGVCAAISENNCGDQNQQTQPECETGDPPGSGHYDCGCTWQSGSCVATSVTYGSCFPSNAKVTLEDGSKVPISSVLKGTKVLSHLNGELLYSPIIGWMHTGKVLSEYHELVHEYGKMRLSGNHFIYVGDYLQGIKAIPAHKLSIGNTLWITKEGDIFPSKIMDINIIHDSGFYAPLVETGNIIVDDILASCYSDEWLSHEIAKFFIRPHSWILSFLNDDSPLVDFPAKDSILQTFWVYFIDPTFDLLFGTRTGGIPRVITHQSM